MSDELMLLSTTMQRILSHAGNHAIDAARTQWPSKVWQELEEAGMTSVGVSDTYGGSGGSLLDVATLVFEVGRHAAPVPLPESTMFAGWLSSAASWDWSGGAETVALSGGTDLIVRRDGNYLVLTGQISNVPWARVATRILAVLETEFGPLLTWIEPESVSIEPGENLANEPRDTIVFASTRLPADRWQVSPFTSQEVKLRGAMMRAISTVGCLYSIIQLTAAYATEREQFGRSLEKFQAIQQLLARLSAEVFASSVSIGKAVSTLNPNYQLFASMSAVVRVASAGTSAARIAHQIHGAIGITEEYPLRLYTNRIWSWRNEFGDETYWSREIANLVHARGGSDNLWPLITDTYEESP